MSRFARLIALTIVMLGCHTEPRFPTPVAPMRDHWVIVRVALRLPIKVEGESTVAVGYYRDIGVRCDPERLKGIIEADVKDGAISWAESEWSEVVINDLDERIRERTRLPAGEGVWYRTGRVFFPDETAAVGIDRN